MGDTKPRPLTSDEWKEIIAIPAIRDAWGLEEDMTPDEFESIVYAAKFNYVSGSPGYIGDLFILQGDVLSDGSPIILKRDKAGKLVLVQE